MKVIVGITIGLGVGLVFAGLVSIFSPFDERRTHFGIVGLGLGLLAGGTVALAILLFQRRPPSAAAAGQFQEKAPS
jgi:hypothetical protein